MAADPLLRSAYTWLVATAALLLGEALVLAGGPALPPDIERRALGAGFVRIRHRYTRGAVATPLVQVSPSVARDMAGEPRWLQLPLRTPISIAREVRESLTVHHQEYDPTMAPRGESAVVVWLETHCDW